MATTIKWIDNNSIETAHRIYKSSTYFDKDNLPAHLVELGPDVTEWEDVDGVDGENWYIVSALLNDYEVFSEPFITGLTIAYIHDVFGDNSAVATYNFDGDATDLGGSFNLPEDNMSFTDGVIQGASRIIGGTSLSEFNTNTEEVSVSSWIKINETTNENRGIIHVSYNSGAIEVGMSDGQIGVAAPVTGSSSLSMFGDMTEDQWVHVVITHSAGETSAYIDGEKQQFSGSSAYYGNMSGLRLAQRTHNTSTIDTTFDQLRIFDRALAQEEIDILYQEGADFL